MAPQLEPLFLSVEHGYLGDRFALYHPPHADVARGLVVYVHPLAEEMNKSRRMAALQSRALAADGFAVLQLDLLGCGDSAGDFGDATWSRWVADVVAACRWLHGRHAPPVGTPVPPMWIWGLRVGCLLAAEAASDLDFACDFVFWQPTVAGSSALQQFLRLKLAGDMLAGNIKGAMAALREKLADGHSPEIAGYVLNPALARGLECASLRPGARACTVEWFEVSANPGGGLAPSSAPVVTRWKEAGCVVRTEVVNGPAFWQSTELQEVPQLVAATSAAFQRARPSESARGFTPSSNVLLRQVDS